MWGVLSDDRMGLSFVYAAGSCPNSLSRVLVPWDLRPYYTVSDLKLPFSSPPTTRRVTMEVSDPAATRVTLVSYVKVKVKITFSRGYENVFVNIRCRGNVC
jgi:hypothetical protein